MEEGQDNYKLGRTVAESCMNHTVTTGELNPGGSESQIYCETYALAIRAGETISERQVSLIRKVKKDKNTLYYDGICDLILERVETHQSGQKELAN